MSKVKVIAGDIPAVEWTASANAQLGFAIFVSLSTPSHPFKGETLTLKIASVEPLTEEKVKKLAGTAGWGLAGAALLGPLGAIGGMLLGGNKTEISFVCNTKDGKRFMGVTDAKFYQQLVAASMSKFG